MTMKSKMKLQWQLTGIQHDDIEKVITAKKWGVNSRNEVYYVTGEIRAPGILHYIGKYWPLTPLGTEPGIPYLPELDAAKAYVGSGGSAVGCLLDGRLRSSAARAEVRAESLADKIRWPKLILPRRVYYVTDGRECNVDKYTTLTQAIEQVRRSNTRGAGVRAGVMLQDWTYRMSAEEFTDSMESLWADMKPAVSKYVEPQRRPRMVLECANVCGAQKWSQNRTNIV